MLISLNSHSTRLIIMLIMIPFLSHAQRFVATERVVLPDSLKEIGIECADLDNDGLADVILFTKSSTNRNHILFIKGDTVAQKQLYSNNVITQPFLSYVIHDYDNDNQLDILLSFSEPSQNSVVLRNQGDFAFETLATDLTQFTLAKFADLDNDGIDDCVLANNSGNKHRIQTYSRKALLDWQLLHDTLMVEATALELFDFDRDGNVNIFFSGRFSADSIASIMMFSGRRS